MFLSDLGIHISDISLGALHAVGLSTLGNVYTWGYNANGQLGTSDTLNRAYPVRVKKREPVCTLTLTLTHANISHTHAHTHTHTHTHTHRACSSSRRWQPGPTTRMPSRTAGTCTLSGPTATGRHKF